MLAPVSVQNPRLAVCAFALSLGVTLALAAPTSAQGLSIGWRDCRSGNGIGGTDEDPDCTPNFNPLSLFPAIRLASRVDSVFAMELVIDVDVATDSLPPWWHVEAGGGLPSERLVREHRAAPQLPGRLGGAGRGVRAGLDPGLPRGLAPARATPRGGRGAARAHGHARGERLLLGLPRRAGAHRPERLRRLYISLLPGVQFSAHPPPAG